MAWTQSDLTVLEAAIRKGARRVQYSTGSVEYQDLNQMRALRDEMKAEIAEAAGTGSSVVFAGRIT